MKSKEKPKITTEATFSYEIDSSSPKRRAKSLLNLSVLERNKAWLEQKKNKIGEKKLEFESNVLKECTFTPTTIVKNKWPKVRKEKVTPDSSFTSTPHSKETFADSIERYAKSNSKLLLYRPLSPFQVSLAFESGFDLQSFMRRVS
jgi:hypothetical protein